MYKYALEKAFKMTEKSNTPQGGIQFWMFAHVNQLWMLFLDSYLEDFAQQLPPLTKKRILGFGMS